MGQVLDHNAECSAIEQHWHSVNQVSVVDGGGAAADGYPSSDFDKVVYDFLVKRHSKSNTHADIEQQVKCDAGRADIVVTLSSGERYIIECKRFQTTELSKNHVDQVIEYRKCLGGEAWIFISRKTELAGNVKEYAKKNDVRIYEFRN